MNPMVAIKKNTLISLIFFFIAIGVIYSNTLNVPWHFDDAPNIVHNKLIHINELSMLSLKQAFLSAKRNDVMFRPLPYISFALNWYFSKNETMVYHIVNIAIHILICFILYLTIIELYKTPIMEGVNDQNDIYLISWLATALWALNPIQTQSVTYIVQRMAQMGAMFYVLGILFYLKARVSQQTKGLGIVQYGCYALVILFFVCAVMSKENTILLPVSLMTIEFIFFKKTKKLYIWFSIILILGGIVVFLFGKGKLLFFLKGYYSRDFTLIQRILTEPGIVLFYITQIFYPLPSRLSITHDIQISNSLFEPFTTFGSILIIAVLIGCSIYFRKKAPLFSFAVLFFFLNHIVESTIIPLELIFEHRNYLPSMFIFLPVASGLCKFFNIYRNKNKIIYWTAFLCTVSVLISFGNFTHERNKAWQSSESLWYDALQKSPGSSRANNNLATVLGWGENSDEKKQDLALKLLKRSLSMPIHRKFLDADALANMALIYFNRGDFPKSLELQKKALKINPGRLKTRFEFAKSLFMLKELDSASLETDLLIKKSGKEVNPDYYHFKGFILLWQDRPEQALVFFQKALKKDPYNLPNILMGTGCALSRIGEYKRAEWFYKFAQTKATLSIQTFFMLIENSLNAGMMEQAIQYARIMSSEFDIFSILRELKYSKDEYKTLPIDKAMIAPVIKKTFSEIYTEAREKKIF